MIVGEIKIVEHRLGSHSGGDLAAGRATHSVGYERNVALGVDGKHVFIVLADATDVGHTSLVAQTHECFCRSSESNSYGPCRQYGKLQSHPATPEFQRTPIVTASLLAPAVVTTNGTAPPGSTLSGTTALT